MCCDGRHIKFPDGSTHKLAFIDISEIIAEKYIIHIEQNSSTYDQDFTGHKCAMHHNGAMVVEALSPLQPERCLQERKTQWVLETT